MPLKSKLEALLLAAPEPVGEQALAEALGEELLAVREALVALEAEYAGRGIRLVRTASGWQLRTAPECADLVRKFLAASPPKLSRAAWEVLAVIAYRQPVTRAEIDALRGVQTSTQVLRQLEEIGWVRVAGRKPVPGRPVLYATTKQFLDDFGLRSLKDLPPTTVLTDDEALAAVLARTRRGD